jgi:hypothetical protein
MSATTRPTTTDALKWGPYLRHIWTTNPDLYPQEAFVIRAMLADAPHGSFARVACWAMRGEDPGEPNCGCGCMSRGSAGET